MSMGVQIFVGLCIVALVFITILFVSYAWHSFADLAAKARLWDELGATHENFLRREQERIRVQIDLDKAKHRVDVLSQLHKSLTDH